MLHRVPLAGAVLATLLVLVPVAGAAPAPPVEQAVTLATPGLPIASTTIGPGGAWSWFSDSRAVSRDGRTYTSWIDIVGRVMVARHDVTTGAVQTTAVAALFDVDDHGNPSLLLHRDGRLSVFWSGHSKGQLHVRTTARAGDLRSFGPRRDVPTQVPGDRVVTYTNPVQVGDRIYLLWRSGVTHQAYAVSRDDGRTWSRARVLVEEPRQRPYVKVDARDDVLALAFTNAHPAATWSSVYYAEVRGDRLTTAAGEDLGPMTGGMRPSQGDLLWDARARQVDAWVWDVAQDAAGNPVVVFATMPTGGPHRYYYARHDGERWNLTELTTAGGSIAGTREPYYSPGIALDHEDPSQLVLSRPVDGVRELEAWRTPDGGRTWLTRPLTVDSPVDNLRPVITRGLSIDEPMGLQWMRGTYGFFTSYRTDIAVSGAVGVGAAEASAVRARVSRTSVPRGSAVTVRGRLVDGRDRGLGGREVTLAKRVGNGRWTRVTERRTGPDGGVVFDVVVGGRASYAVLWPGDSEHRPSWSPSTEVAATDSSTG